MCCRRRPTTTSSGPSRWASAPPPPPWRSCHRRGAAVSFDPMALVTTALDALASASPEAIDVAAVRGIWLLLGVLGFEPSLVACVRDGTAIASDGQDPVPFSIADGGVACPRCTPTQPFTRLPRQAYRDLLALTDAREELPRLDAQHAAAHRRLVARFVRHHFGETGALSALDFWERRAWASTPPTPVPSAAS